jgi:hypothetical protein
VRLGITFGYLLFPVIREECRDSIFGVLPRFWACFSTVRVVFSLGAMGRDSPKAGSTKWEKSVDDLGENVQAKSLRYLRFRIFIVRLFVTTYTDGTMPA